MVLCCSRWQLLGASLLMLILRLRCFLHKLYLAVRKTISFIVLALGWYCHGQKHEPNPIWATWDALDLLLCML